MRSIIFALALGCAALAAAPGTAQTSNPPPTTVPPSTWEKIKGSWTDTKGVVKENWGKLTDNDLLEIEGRRDQLVGKIQVRYGVSREEAERQVQGAAPAIAPKTATSHTKAQHKGLAATGNS